MNPEEIKVSKLLLADIEKHSEPKDRFDALIRYDVFTRAVWQRAQAENLAQQKK